jgi:hypothetical protein
MKDFKFFKGTLDVMDDITRATASFNDDTPEGYMSRRILYHTNLPEYERLRTQMTNDSRDLNDNPIRLFQTTTTVSVNPTLWNRFKIFGTSVRLVLIESWRAEPIGVVVASVLLTLVTIIGIAKILSLW